MNPDRDVERKSVDVSVIVANFNNGRYLRDFFHSVLASTVCPRELIFVDDGSTDDSREQLSEYQDIPYLKLILFNNNKGFTKALNVALELASSKYILRVDSDDMMLPDRLERQFRFMEEHPEVDVSGANVIYCQDQRMEPINRSNFPTRHAQIVKTYRRGEHGMLHATVIAKAAVYKAYRYQDIFPSEDYELFSRMVRDGRCFANLHKPVNLVRVHPRSSTSNLTINSIRYTFRLRDEIFSTKTARARIWLYFYHIRYYRKYQLNNSQVTRHLFLLMSSLFYPSKILRRLRYLQ
jgi:glycosyltransferase involved in cell wall biosynthesis